MNRHPPNCCCSGPGCRPHLSVPLRANVAGDELAALQRYAHQQLVNLARELAELRELAREVGPCAAGSPCTAPALARRVLAFVALLDPHQDELAAVLPLGAWAEYLAAAAASTSLIPDEEVRTQ